MPREGGKHQEEKGRALGGEIYQGLPRGWDGPVRLPLRQELRGGRRRKPPRWRKPPSPEGPTPVCRWSLTVLLPNGSPANGTASGSPPIFTTAGWPTPTSARSWEGSGCGSSRQETLARYVDHKLTGDGWTERAACLSRRCGTYWPLCGRSSPRRRKGIYGPRHGQKAPKTSMEISNSVPAGSGAPGALPEQRSDDACRFGVYLCLYTGLRIGEVCGLRWETSG